MKAMDPGWRIASAEDLDAALALAQMIAPRSCQGCAWYHGFYPLLRRVGLAATPERHRAFYLEAFAGLAREGSRVLITGAADACMLAHVVEGFQGAGVEPAVTVLDRCATPLALCQAYGAKAGLQVAAVAADILAFAAPEPFDLLTTHAFLGMLPRRDQPALLARLRALLRPGGRLVTVARVDPAWSPEHPGFSPDQAEAFARLVAVQAGHPALRGTPWTAGSLREAARAYGERMASHPFPDEATLEAEFRAAGWRFEHLDVHTVEARAGAHESGPGVNRPGTFARIVAVA